MEDMSSPAFIEKVKAGPVAFMTVRPAGWNFNMGGTLFQWFVYSIVVSLFAGYIAGISSRARHGISADHAGRRLRGVRRLLRWRKSHDSIWWGSRWSGTIRNMLDGLSMVC